MTPEQAIGALWRAWLVGWVIAVLWSSRTEKRDAIGPELLFRVLFYASVILLFAFPPVAHTYAQMQLWHFGAAMNWILVVPTAAGLLFTWWARIHLGRLWSDRVVKKSGHHVVDTGPYRIVRHPIYSGLIFAAFATATEQGTLSAVLGAAIVTLAFYIKARREERFLRAELGESAYDDYARKTAMLVPFVGVDG
ncbi:MAG: isoprenylcysteine carboxylmethyltransferase family protein [Acidobacteriota bacterium]